MKTAVLILAIILMASSSYGDCDAEGNLDYGYPKPGCEQPVKPDCLSDRSCSEEDMANFKSELENYKNCINAYIDKVKIDVDCARQRASEAAEEYNIFVKDF
ncbi:MAG: hypothetical protein JSV83_02745 [Desulfobacterales bacterium]|nr:MAG: hypothetical protein JSV83_02745 [Desulfobacterales bacterium]